MVPSQGNVSVSSSPPGANVFIDDVYEGITPVNLTGISSGSHVLRLQINGYGDFETSIQVSSGETTIAFGSLDIRNRTVTTPATVTMTPTDTLLGLDKPNSHSSGDWEYCSDIRGDCYHTLNLSEAAVS